MANSARRRRFRMVLLLTLVVSLVFLDGASMEEPPRMESWEAPDASYDTDNDDPYFDGARNRRQNHGTSTTTEMPTTTTEMSSPDTSTTDSTTTLPPPLPPATDPPDDNCGTKYVSTIGINDPGPCFIDPSAPSPSPPCPSGICMKDFSNPDLYSCLWRSTSSDPNATDIMVEVPGHCDLNNIPKEFANSTEKPIASCQLANTAPILELTKCVCSSWNSSCPDEPALNSCEVGMVKLLAEEFIRKIAEISERVNFDCPCDYELEQKLPLAMEALKQEKNLYRTVMLLLEARTKHICNRRRLMTCRPNGKCGCAPGTARRVHQTDNALYKSYYCYPNQGPCDKDPAEVIDQFNHVKEMVWQHYGDPTNTTHKNATNQCYFNLCRNAEDVRGKTCADFDVDY